MVFDAGMQAMAGRIALDMASQRAQWLAAQLVRTMRARLQEGGRVLPDEALSQQENPQNGTQELTISGVAWAALEFGTVSQMAQPFIIPSVEEVSALSR